MLIHLSHNLVLFCVAIGFMQLLSFIMALQGRNFYTKDVVVRKFSIMDLELAATATEIVNIVKGLYQLPDARQSKKAVSSLKGQLYLDFGFMPFAYGAVFLVCMHVSGKMTTDFGRYFFAILAWLQAIPWLCDIIENIYLLQKIRPQPVASTPAVHTAYLRMEALKWGLVLIAAVSAGMMECYCWLSGNYAPGSLLYLGIAVGETVVFLLAAKLFVRENIDTAKASPNLIS